MFTLLYKDFLLLRKEKMGWFMLALTFLAGIDLGRGGGLGLTFLIILPAYWAVAYSNAYDYKYGAEAFLASLPLPRSAVVAEKYLLSLILSLVGIGCTLLGSALGLLVAGPVASFPWSFAPLAFAACAFYSALSLAAYFRFGYLSSRWVTFVLMGSVGALFGVFAGANLGGGILEKRLPGLAGAGLVAVLALLFLGLSFLYARRRFAKKEL